MKLLTAFVTLVFSLTLLPDATLQAQFRDKVYRTESFSVSGPTELKVRTSGGYISVEGGTDGEITVEMIVKKRGRTITPSDSDLEDFDITIDQRGNEVLASAERKKSGMWRNRDGISISFKVTTPRDTQTDLSTSGGSLSLSNLEGTQDARTSGGAIRLEDLTGTINARTSGGSINLKRLEGDIEVRTSGGAIRADQLAGTIELRTSGGSISMDQLSGSIDARTSGGSIRGEFTQITDQLTLRTSGGNIKVSVPGDLGMDLKVRGNYVDMPLRNFTGESKRNRINGEMNGGGVDVELTTSGGGVKVTFI